MAPKRIQLRRTKGWRKPEGAIVVARPSKWGNPWPIGSMVHAQLEDGTERYELVKTPAGVVSIFRRWLLSPAPEPTALRSKLDELRGHDLACWCPLDQPCHADVLLELANAGEA